MKKSLLLFACIAIAATTSSQNLVPNPDFETTGTIPCGWTGSSIDFANALINWTSPTTATPDAQSTLVLNTCTNFHPNTNVSSNGSQMPHSGNTFAGFYTQVGASTWREYVQVQLTAPLVPGIPYKVEFYVSLGEQSQFATNNIGVGFSTTLTNSPISNELGYPPQVLFTNVVSDTANWTLLSAVFIPTQPFEFIIIGNFFDDANTTIVTVSPTATWDRSYYYIDDFSVSPMGPNVTGTCFGDSTYFSLYPNPDVIANFWDFGDTASSNNTAFISDPVHLYTAPGSYNVMTVNFNISGTSDTFYTVVNIGLPPVITLGNDTVICNGDSVQLNAGGPFTSYLWSDGSTGSSIYASAAGTFFVAVDNSGCPGNDTINVSFIPCSIPGVFLSSSDTVWCDKKAIDFFDLSINNPTSWQWTFQGAVPSTSNLQNPTGIYYANYGSFDVTLIACNPSGCDTLFLPGFINEYQLPVAPVITQSFDTLFSTPAFSYQWYLVPNMIPGATNQFYVTSQPGSYYVEISDSNGCKVTGNIIVVAGINELFNPGSYVNIKKVSLYDAAGRLLFTNQVTNGDLNDALKQMHSYAEGIYFLTAEGKNFRKTVKYFNGAARQK